MSVNEVLLEHSRVHGLRIAYGCFPSTRGKLSSCNRYLMALIPWRTKPKMLLAFHRKTVAAPALDTNRPGQCCPSGIPQVPSQGVGNSSYNCPMHPELFI